MNELSWVITAINLLTFCLFLADKLLARGRHRRIPEAALLTLCAVFGSVGGMFGMGILRHKTNARKHPSFVYGVPLLFWIQLEIGLFFVIRAR